MDARFSLKKRILSLFIACALAVPAAGTAAPATEVQAASSVTVKLNRKNYKSDQTVKKLYEALMSGKKITIVSTEKDIKHWSAGDLFYGCSGCVSGDYALGLFPVDYVDEDTRNKSYKQNKLVIPASASKAYAKDVRRAQGYYKHPVTAADQELAQQIHDTLMTRQAFSFCTKGKPDKICQKLNEMMPGINRQGVHFEYESGKIKGDIYLVTVTNELAEAYYYAVKMTEKILKIDQYDIERLLLEDVEEYQEAVAEDPEEFEGFGPYTYEDAFADLPLAKQIIMNADCMNDLSDIMKVYAISYAGVFNCGEAGTVGITYTFKNQTPFLTAKATHQYILKHLCNGTARGVCEDFARGERVYFTYLGIDVKEKDGNNHAWTEGQAANSKGEMVKFKFDYELMLSRKDGTGYYESGTSGNSDRLN